MGRYDSILGVLRSRAVLSAVAACVAAGVAAGFAVRAKRLHDQGSRDLAEAVARFESEFGPLDPERWSIPPLPDADRAAAVVRAADAACTLSDKGPKDDSDENVVRRCAYAQWTPDHPRDGDRARILVESHVPVIAALDAFRAERLGTFPVKPSRATSGPDILRMMPLVQCDGQLAVGDRDWERACRRIEAVGAILEARFRTKHKWRLFWDGRYLTFAQLALVRALVADASTPAETLRRAAAGLPRIDFLAAAQEHETWAFVQLADAVREDRRFLSDEVMGGGEWLVPGLRAANRWVTENAQRARMYESAGDRLRLMGRPWAEVGTELEPQSLPDLARAIGSGSHGSPALGPAATLQSTIGTTSLMASEMHTVVALARRALALRLEAIERGAYPSKPQRTREGRIENALSGRPFRWSVARDGSAVLSAPDAARVVQEQRGTPPVFDWFTWTLPAPRPLSARPAPPSASSPS